MVVFAGLADPIVRLEADDTAAFLTAAVGTWIDRGGLVILLLAETGDGAGAGIGFGGAGDGAFEPNRNPFVAGWKDGAVIAGVA